MSRRANPVRYSTSTTQAFPPNNWINDTPLTYARYRNNGHVNQPGYPIFCIHWSWRQYDADGTSLASDPFSDLFMYPTPVYMERSENGSEARDMPSASYCLHDQ